MTTTAERVDKLYEVVEGNGSIGLKGKVVQLDTKLDGRVSEMNVKLDGVKEDISDVKKAVDKVEEGQRWAMRFALMQAIAFVAAVVIYIVNNG